jgi:hypothetical protein
MGKYNYFSELDALFMGGNATGFFSNMIAEIDRRKHLEKLEKAGVSFNKEFGFFGVPSKGIPYDYDNIDFVNNKFYYCSVVFEDMTKVDVFDENGKFLFFSFDDCFEYIGEDFFLVKEKKNSLSALYKLGECVSDFVFRSRHNTKFSDKSEFCVLGYGEGYSVECVVNKEGKIVHESKGLQSAYLHGNTFNDGKNYINLFTGEIICKSGYRATLQAGDLMFVEDDEQVYKINQITCEVEVFGEPKTSRKPSDIKLCEGSPVTVAEALPKVPKAPKLNRNDICSCGSEKKYKHCCGK